MDNTWTRFESKLSNYDRMMSIGTVLDGGSIPPTSTKVYSMSIFCWGCQVSTGQGRKMDDSAMLKSIGLGFLGRRSK